MTRRLDCRLFEVHIPGLFRMEIRGGRKEDPSEKAGGCD